MLTSDRSQRAIPRSKGNVDEGIVELVCAIGSIADGIPVLCPFADELLVVYVVDGFLGVGIGTRANDRSEKATSSKKSLTH